MNSITQLLIPAKIDSLGERGNLKRQRVLLGALCLKICQSAFKSYCERDLRKFDPLVGEQACQLRALMIIKMILNEKISLERLLAFNESVNKAIKAIEEDEEQPEESIKLSSYLESEYGASMELGNLSSDEEIIILSYLLTLTRGALNPSETDEQLLNNLLDFPCDPYDLREIVYAAKRKLAHASIKFLQYEAKNSSIEGILKFLTDRQLKDASGQGLKTSPLYFNIRVVLDSLKSSAALLAITIKGDALAQPILLHSNQDKVFELASLSMDAQSPVFVVELERNSAESEEDPFLVLRRKLAERGDVKRKFPYSRVEAIVLKSSAIHPQYAGKVKDELIPLPEHEDLKPLLGHLLGLGNINGEEIPQILTKHFGNKQVSRAETLCRPSNLSAISMEYLQFQKMKEKGMKSLPLKVVHIYLSTFQVVRSGHV